MFRENILLSRFYVSCKVKETTLLKYFSKRKHLENIFENYFVDAGDIQSNLSAVNFFA